MSEISRALSPRVGNCAVACKFFVVTHEPRELREKIARGSTGGLWRRKSKRLVRCRHAGRGTERRVYMCTHGGNLILLSAYNTQLSPGWTETQHLPWRIRPVPRLVFHRRRLVTSLGGWRRGLG